IGTWSLVGGTLSNGHVATSGGAQLILSTGSLDGITLDAGSEAVTTTSAVVNVFHDLSIDGQLTLGRKGGSDGFAYGLFVYGAQARLGGSGRIAFTSTGFGSGGATGPQAIVGGTSGMTLTIGEQLTVLGGSGFLMATNAATGVTLRNEGTIEVNGTGTFAVGTNDFFYNASNLGQIVNTPTGRIRVTGAGSLSVTGSQFTNDGSLYVSNGTLSVSSPTWSSPGSIHQAGGTLNLGGSFTPSQLSTFTRENDKVSTLNVTGTLNLDGGTLSLTNASDGFGTMTLTGGTLANGHVATSGGAQLILSTGSLDGITLDAGSETVTTTSAVINVFHDLTIDGQLNLGLKGGSDGFANGLFVYGAQARLGGSGRIAFTSTGFGVGGATGPQAIVGGTSGMTLTIGEQLTVLGGSGFLMATNAATGVTLRNEGTIEVNGTGTFAVGTNDFFYNASNLGQIVNTPTGRIRVTGAGSLSLTGSQFTNNGSLYVSHGTLSVSSPTWSSPGAIHQAGGTLNLGGSFTPNQLSTFTRENDKVSTLNVTGTLDLGGGTLLLANASDGYGTMTLTGGTLANGHIATSGGAQLILSTGSLDGITLDAGSETVTTTSAVINVFHDLTIDGQLNLGLKG
ncbi:MAG TPA: hypothetical protein PLV92_19130, partial [Pirellulaceae bacterium]|nr:hypothetical protein [Pirellulaceae bacterium]